MNKDRDTYALLHALHYPNNFGVIGMECCSLRPMSVPYNLLWRTVPSRVAAAND